MANLTHYLTQWNLTDAEQIARTPTSSVYRVTYQGQKAVLKLLTPIGVQDESGGAVALRFFDGKGAVRLLHSAKRAHLLEYVDGDDLIPMVERGEDEQAMHIIADVLQTLHLSQRSTLTDGLIPLRRRFHSLFQKARGDWVYGRETIYTRADVVADQLTRNHYKACVLHGDIHHQNVRYSSARGWLAYDPKGLFGERTFDVANALCNPASMPELVRDEARLHRNVAIFADKLRIPGSRIMDYVFIYAALSACWLLEEGQNPEYALHMAQLAEANRGRV
jgi:streptomycin 6-kinase